MARSTIATMLRQQGIPPSGERPTSWQTFLRTHGGALVAADCFTTEVWTLRGLVTSYTLFVIELPSRRVHIVGSTPHPDEGVMRQIARHLTDATDGVRGGPGFLICDRDRKWSPGVRQLLDTSGVGIIPRATRQCACGAVCRSVKEECLNRVILSVSGTSVVHSRSSSSTIIANAIIRGSAANWSTASEFSLAAAAFGDVSASVAFSVTTIVRRSHAAQNRLGGIVGHYELPGLGRTTAMRRILEQMSRSARTS